MLNCLHPRRPRKSGRSRFAPTSKSICRGFCFGYVLFTCRLVRIFLIAGMAVAPHPRARSALFLRPQPNLLRSVKAKAAADMLGRRLALLAFSCERALAAAGLAE